MHPPLSRRLALPSLTVATGLIAIALPAQYYVLLLDFIQSQRTAYTGQADSPLALLFLPAITLGLLALGGVGLTVWGLRHFIITLRRTAATDLQAVEPPPSTRRALLAGVALAFAYAQAMVLSGILQLQGNSGLSNMLFFLSTPAMILRPCVFFAPEGVAPTFVLSAIFWFGVGAVAAARARRTWLIVVMVIVLFVAMMVLGLVLAIIAMMQSSP